MPWAEYEAFAAASRSVLDGEADCQRLDHLEEIEAVHTHAGLRRLMVEGDRVAIEPLPPLWAGGLQRRIPGGARARALAGTPASRVKVRRART
jgi:hypothetical protein